MKNNHTLELVVTDGYQAGARSIVKNGQVIELSDSIDSDIVLSDPGMSGKKIKLIIDNDNARLDVVSGEVNIMGQRFSQGQTADLPAYQVASIGNSAFAYGETNNHRWQDLLSIGINSDENEVKQWLDEDEIKDDSGEVKSKPIIAIIVFLCFLSVGIYFFVTFYSPSKSVDSIALLEEKSTYFQSLLVDAGYEELIVAPLGGEMVVSGYIPTFERYAKFEKLLSDNAIQASLSVQVGEQLATQVQDVYRVNGINTVVHIKAKGVVEITSSEISTEKINKIKNVALKDIDHLKKIIVNNKAPVVEIKDDSFFVSDPNKKIAMIVKGDTSYIVTVDRSRYYIGALLPSGHIVTQITDTTVTLTKGESVTLLDF